MKRWLKQRKEADGSIEEQLQGEIRNLKDKVKVLETRVESLGGCCSTISIEPLPPPPIKVLRGLAAKFVGKDEHGNRAIYVGGKQPGCILIGRNKKVVWEERQQVKVHIGGLKAIGVVLRYYDMYPWMSYAELNGNNLAALGNPPLCADEVPRKEFGMFGARPGSFIVGEADKSYAWQANGSYEDGKVAGAKLGKVLFKWDGHRSPRFAGVVVDVKPDGETITFIVFTSQWLETFADTSKMPWYFEEHPDRRPVFSWAI